MSGGDPHRPLVFLHVGAMKTGTTYLQSLLHANREHLADAGYLRPGGSFAAHSPAVRDALGMAADEQERARLAGRWDRLRARVLRHEGPAAVLSNEFLSFAGPRQAADIARSLSRPRSGWSSRSGTSTRSSRASGRHPYATVAPPPGRSSRTWC